MSKLEDERLEDVIIGGPEIPDSVSKSLQRMLDDLEEQGVVFRSGRTALYWHLVAVVAQHFCSR